MPELPDIQVFSSNLNKIFAGKKLNNLKVIQGKKLQDTEKEFTTNVNGKTLNEIYRSGKEMKFAFDDGTLLGLHLMLTKKQICPS